MEETMYTEKNLAALLRKLGMPCGLKGYRCIKEAVKILFEEGGYVPIGVLEKRVGEVYGASVMQVERNMREAVRQSMANSEPDDLKKVFGKVFNPNKNMTLSEYVAGIYEYCMLHDIEEEEAAS